MFGYEWVGPPVRRIEALLALFSLHQGRHVDIRPWAREALSRPVTWEEPWEAIALAYFLAHDKKGGEALLLLEHFIQECRQASAGDALIKSLAHLAALLQAQKKAEAARSCLAEALSLAEPHGYIQSFLGAGPPLAALLPSLAHDSPYARRLLALIPESETDGILSEREVEILQLIEAGLSNQQISEKLFVSLNTVKTHVKNIFRKLEVPSRAQALVKAYQLGLLQQ